MDRFVEDLEAHNKEVIAMQIELEAAQKKAPKPQRKRAKKA